MSNLRQVLFSNDSSPMAFNGLNLTAGNTQASLNSPKGKLSLSGMLLDRGPAFSQMKKHT